MNAARYGHATEHAAESILVVVTFASVCCGVLSAAMAAAGTKAMTRLKHG